MEDKHIYSSSGWFKFLNSLKPYKDAFKELVFYLDRVKLKIIHELTKAKPPPLPRPDESPKPKTTKTLLTDRNINKVPYGENVEIKIPKKLSESGAKILTYALFVAIAAVMILGIIFSLRK